MAKKVCVLTSVHRPFDGRIFHRQASCLLKGNYDVVLIAQHGKTEVINGIKIKPLPKPKNRVDRMTTILWRLFCLAMKENADVYHFHDPELIIVGVMLKIFTKGKVIYDVHEHYPKAIEDKYWIPKLIRKLISSGFSLFEYIFVPVLDYVIYTTQVIGVRYQKMDVSASSIENYPPLELSKNYTQSSNKYIVYLGGMTEIRGAREILKAFSIVIKKYPNWNMYVVGKILPDSFAKEIMNLINDLGIKNNLELIPWVPYEEKNRYLFQASMGIVTYLPYGNNMSALPNKMFEYMSTKLPLIASNFPLYRGVIEGNKCGILVDPTNVNEIAQAMIYIVEHEQEGRKMGLNGYEAVLKKYNWEKESEKLLNIYSEVLN